MTGLIPAGAGSTAFRVPKLRPPTAHPRWRGEHAVTAAKESEKWGSSPLARGARVFRVHVALIGRLIPAGAGSTASSGFPSSSPRAHPRWRGEHLVSTSIHTGRFGSSPLARGARCGCLLGWGGGGLIPAGAGSTVRGWTGPSLWGAHPRWRGEHEELVGELDVAVGSSPLARGAPPRCRVGTIGGGLIPAGAGSTGFQPCQPWR